MTARLLSMAHPMHELLITAAARTVTAWRRRRGQETPAPLLALERTVARTSTSARPPIPATRSDCSAQSTHCASTPTASPVSPYHGSCIDYSLPVRYLRSDSQLREHPEPQLLLNYLGSVHAAVGDLELDRELMAEMGRVPEPEQAVRHELTLVAGILGTGDARVLAAQWRALPDILDDADITALQQRLD